jgi:hypothetical protein
VQRDDHPASSGTPCYVKQEDSPVGSHSLSCIRSSHEHCSNPGLIQKAGCGLYCPKGFAEEEDLQTLLFLHLGGQQVAEIAHCMFRIPAPSTVCHHTMIPPLICSPSYPIVKGLKSNLETTFDSLLPALAVQGKYQDILMLDEIAQEGIHNGVIR